jgi:hypothetical protein
MDPRQPLRSPAPSLDAATRTVLARAESGKGTSRIRRLAGRGSWAGRQRVLSGPATIGFTDRLPGQPLLSPAMLTTTRLRQQMPTRLTSAVADMHRAREHASVVGSFVCGEDSERSDIDLSLTQARRVRRGRGHRGRRLAGTRGPGAHLAGNQLQVLVFDHSKLVDVDPSSEPNLPSPRTETVSGVLAPVHS